MIGVLIEEEIRTQKHIRTWGEFSHLHTQERYENILYDTLILEAQAPGLRKISGPYLSCLHCPVSGAR